MKILAATMLAALPFAPVGAQAGPAPLAANEVLLQIQAVGEAVTPADRVSFNAVLQTSGKDVASARAANEAKFEETMVAVRKAGAPQLVRVLGNAGSMGIVGNEEMTVFAPEAGDGQVAPPPGKTVRNMISVNGADPKAAGAIRDALEASGATYVQGPNYTLERSAAAQQAARMDAIAKAREEAESYAAALGMRIVRMIRFSNTGERDNLMDMQQMFRSMAGNAADPMDRVRTAVTVRVDYALAPE